MREHLTFRLTSQNQRSTVRLVPCDADSVGASSWQELAQRVAAEPHLRRCSPQALANRWKDGLASIALRDGHIVSYTSLVPILDAATWPRLAAAFGSNLTHGCPIAVYGASTGWTVPELRKQDVSLSLRVPLLARLSASESLVISIAVGFGASAVLEKLGWQMLPWSRIPYLSSLDTLKVSEFSQGLETVWRVPEGMAPYEGPHIPAAGFQHHVWDKYYHLWLSNVEMAINTNSWLEHALDGNLQHWRRAIANVFTAGPDPQWVLSACGE
jgi:hypothetical protein